MSNKTIANSEFPCIICSADLFRLVMRGRRWELHCYAPKLRAYATTTSLTSCIRILDVSLLTYIYINSIDLGILIAYIPSTHSEYTLNTNIEAARGVVGSRYYYMSAFTQHRANREATGGFAFLVHTRNQAVQPKWRSRSGSAAAPCHQHNLQ